MQSQDDGIRESISLQSIKTISTVRTMLAVILVLLFLSLALQWMMVRQLEIRVRFLENYRTTHTAAHAAKQTKEMPDATEKTPPP